MQNHLNIISSGFFFKVNFKNYIHHSFQTGRDNFTCRQYFEYKSSGNFMEYSFYFFI